MGTEPTSFLLGVQATWKNQDLMTLNRIKGRPEAPCAESPDLLCPPNCPHEMEMRPKLDLYLDRKVKKVQPAKKRKSKHAKPMQMEVRNACLLRRSSRAALSNGVNE